MINTPFQISVNNKLFNICYEVYWLRIRENVTQIPTSTFRKISSRWIKELNIKKSSKIF